MGKHLSEITEKNGLNRMLINDTMKRLPKCFGYLPLCFSGQEDTARRKL